MSEALTAPRRRVDAIRHSVGLVASLVLLAGLFWSSLASAAPSTYPGCATRNVSVAWGGSVYVDLSTCHDFGLGVVSVAPAHGSTSEVGAPVNGYTYAHNGATPVGGGSDTFVRKATLEYHQPARFDDELEVCGRTARLGRSSLRFVVEMYRRGATATPLIEAGGLKLFMLAGYVQAEDGRLSSAPGTLSGVIGAAPQF